MVIVHGKKETYQLLPLSINHRRSLYQQSSVMRFPMSTMNHQPSMFSLLRLVIIRHHVSHLFPTPVAGKSNIILIVIIAILFNA